MTIKLYILTRNTALSPGYLVCVFGVCVLASVQERSSFVNMSRDHTEIPRIGKVRESG